MGAVDLTMGRAGSSLPMSWLFPRRPEIRVIHEFKNGGNEVFQSGTNPKGRHETLDIETTVCQCFFMRPLRVTFSE